MVAARVEAHVSSNRMRFLYVLPVVFGLALLLALVGHPSASAAGGNVTDERWLEGRLIAPCCWMQTLDVHESPLAHDLRAEIHTRLSSGETPSAIEDDLAARYGEAIRALPKGKDPRNRITVFVAVLLVAGGIGLRRLMKRWTRPGSPLVPATAGARDAFDERLDDELRDLDE